MNERVTRFYEAMSRDGGLQEELNVVAAGVEFSRDEAVRRRNMAEAVAAFACAHGFDLTADELFVTETRPDRELSEDELMAVSGGIDYSKGTDWQDAYHEYLGGGGSLDFWHWITTLV